MELRGGVKETIVSKHFKRDVKEEGQIRRIVNDIMDSESLHHAELHKFEENIDGMPVFRAKKDGIHCLKARILSQTLVCRGIALLSP